MKKKDKDFIQSKVSGLQVKFILFFDIVYLLVWQVQI